jgi:hypothetical protein
MTQTLNTVTTGAVINSDEYFYMCHLHAENGSHISAKLLGNRFQDNTQEIHGETKLGKTGARLKMSLRNFSAQFVQQMGVCIITIKYNKTDVSAFV